MYIRKTCVHKNFSNWMLWLKKLCKNNWILWHGRVTEYHIDMTWSCYWRDIYLLQIDLTIILLVSMVHGVIFLGRNITWAISFKLGKFVTLDLFHQIFWSIRTYFTMPIHHLQSHTVWLHLEIVYYQLLTLYNIACRYAYDDKIICTSHCGPNSPSNIHLFKH
jgi:hypothetical protein